MIIKVKLKRCKVCKDEFYPGRPLQQVCSMECAVSLARVKTEKADKEHAKVNRAALKAAKLAIKPISYWRQRAQKEFNAFIRLRDEKLPCISCGRHHQGQYHAGHYRTTAAAPELRFNELNVWKQCAPCNNHKHGNITEYRINLIKRIGIEQVEWLESVHEPKHYKISDLQEIEQKYLKLAKELKNERI